MANLRPHDIERAVIGSVLLSPERMEEVVHSLNEADFSESKCATTYQLMRQVYEVEGLITSELLLNGGLGADDYHRFMDAAGSLSLLERNMNIVLEAAALRRVQTRAVWLSNQIAEGLVELEDARDTLAAIAEKATTASMKSPALSFIEWITQAREHPPKWVIHRVLREKERLLFVGPEGMGKSVLNFQIAVTTALGIHPFGGRDGDPQKVVIVDCENSNLSTSINGTYSLASPEGILAQAHRHAPGRAVETLLAENLFIWADIRINLRRPEWRRQMDLVMREHRPALVIIGPVYRVWPREHSDDWDEQAQGFQRYIDSLRARFGSAFWIEHHAPKGSAKADTISSYGSSFWERWPEVGRGAVPVEDDLGRKGYDATRYRLDRLRGDRGERGLPIGLRHGNPTDEEWPWMATNQP